MPVKTSDLLHVLTARRDAVKAHRDDLAKHAKERGRKAPRGTAAMLAETTIDIRLAGDGGVMLDGVAVAGTVANVAELTGGFFELMPALRWLEALKDKRRGFRPDLSVAVSGQTSMEHTERYYREKHVRGEAIPVPATVHAAALILTATDKRGCRSTLTLAVKGANLGKPCAKVQPAPTSWREMPRERPVALEAAKPAPRKRTAKPAPAAPAYVPNFVLVTDQPVALDPVIARLALLSVANALSISL
jgi:hypothetical protein